MRVFFFSRDCELVPLLREPLGEAEKFMLPKAQGSLYPLPSATEIAVERQHQTRGRGARSYECVGTPDIAETRRFSYSRLAQVRP